MRRENHTAQRTRTPVFRDSLFVFLHEIQRRGVDAIAKTGRPWPVGENVAEMRVTSAAEHFLARHSMARVSIHFNFRFIDWRREARPPGTGMIFRFGAKQRLAAANADVRSGRVGIFILTSSRWFRALAPGHLVLLGRQDLPPLGVSPANFFTHFRPPNEYLSIERKSDGMIHQLGRRVLALGVPIRIFLKSSVEVPGRVYREA